MSLEQILSRNLRSARLPQRFQPLLGQAGSEAIVRFGPQWDELGMLREQSAQQMRQQRAQAISAGQLVSALAGQARHQLLTETNPAIQQALAYEQAPEGSSTQRVGLGLALGHDATANLLSQAALDAPIRAAQQAQQAQAQHLQDLDKINAQRRAVLGQAGSYITGRTQDLITGDRKQRSQLNQNLRTVRTRLQTAQLSADTQRRGQDITVRGQDLSHADRQAAVQQRREAAARRRQQTKSGFLNPNQQATVVGKVKGAQQAIGQLMSTPGAVKSEVETLLRAGKVDGVKYSQPEIDVAFDLHRNRGKLSPRGVRVAHRTLRVQVRGNFGLLPRGAAIGPPAPAGPAGPLG